jgi:diacylglycerol kinase family enzyme
MRYAIIANPVAGKLTVDQKLSALAHAAEILDAKIYGLDTSTAEEFGQCARELAVRFDVLVTAGGDGTLSDIINSIDTARIPVGFLPLGTGNAMRHALKYKGHVGDMAARIRDGEIHEYDLIDCDGKRRAFTVSVGIEGTIIRLWGQYRLRGGTGLMTYCRAILNAYLREYKRTTAKITIGGNIFEISDLLSLMIVKQPFYGFGMRVVPQARFDDGKLHILCLNVGLFKSAIGGVSAFVIGNRIGEYCACRQLILEVKRPLVMQNDGNEAWEANKFVFTVLPKALKIKC